MALAGIATGGWAQVWRCRTGDEWWQTLALALSREIGHPLRGFENASSNRVNECAVGVNLTITARACPGAVRRDGPGR